MKSATENNSGGIFGKNLCFLGLFLMFALGSANASALAKDIYLVRHLEKQKPTEQSGPDVHLTKIGNANAHLLASWMQGKDLANLFTTDYNRTKQSIQPTAIANTLDPIFYDPSNLGSFAADLKLLEGNSLILGHSNTTGVLYGLLGCEEVLLSESDYGDIFKVSLGSVEPKVACERFSVD